MAKGQLKTQVQKVKSRYYCRDARELSEVLSNESVDVTITSPPYWSMKDYGSGEPIGIKQSYGPFPSQSRAVLVTTILVEQSVYRFGRRLASKK
jgi:DNA modification methylase